MNLQDFIKLTRFEHAILFAISVFIASYIAGGINFFSLLIPIFSEIGAFALNDYFDIEADIINKRYERPLVNGSIKKEEALVIIILAYLFSTIISAFINEAIFLLTLIINIFSILYNYKLKELPLVGNLYIAFTMGIPFIFGNLVITEKIHTINLILALMGFLGGLAREIVKTVQDMEGDKKARNAKTLPILIGKRPSLNIAIILYFFLILISFYPYSLFKNKIPYVFIFLGDIGILYNIIGIIKGKNLESLRKISLFSIFVALIGFLLLVILNKVF